MLVSLVVFFLICLGGGAPLAWAWNEPTGFRGIPWGASPVEAKQHMPELDCYGKCLGHVTIGAVHTTVYMEFETNGGLDLVVLSFPADNFPDVRTTFIERYGEPTKRSTHPVQNRMGATFENEELEWRGARVVIVLQKYGSRVTEGAAVLQTTERLRTRRERSQEKAKKGKDDL